jgi:dTDP-4-dehydrorhamnose reductase
MICDKIGANMIHITTDCVFDGKLGKYNEDSQHTETNDYGISKSLGELCDATIIRTSIIGEEITNKRSLLEWVRNNQGSKINGFTQHYWNGVTCLELAKVVLEVIGKELYWKGVRHLFSPTSVTKYELVKMISDVYELYIEVVQYETDKVDKTLSTIYDKQFEIKELLEQVKELKDYKI